MLYLPRPFTLFSFALKMKQCVHIKFNNNNLNSVQNVALMCPLGQNME